LEDSFSSIFISQFLDESFDSDFDYDDVLIYGDMFKFFDFSNEKNYNNFLYKDGVFEKKYK
jgi:hypothetical protein